MLRLPARVAPPWPRCAVGQSESLTPSLPRFHLSMRGHADRVHVVTDMHPTCPYQGRPDAHADALTGLSGTRLQGSTRPNHELLPMSQEAFSVTLMSSILALTKNLFTNNTEAQLPTARTPKWIADQYKQQSMWRRKSVGTARDTAFLVGSNVMYAGLHSLADAVRGGEDPLNEAFAASLTAGFIAATRKLLPCLQRWVHFSCLWRRVCRGGALNHFRVSALSC
jgi:hypothetical protein